MLTENEKLIIRSFLTNKSKFVSSLNSMISDPNTPGSSSDKIAAIQDVANLITLVESSNQNKRQIILDWFNNASQEGKALFVNAARYVSQGDYQLAINNTEVLKCKIKKIEEIKNGDHCNYGYGYGLDHGNINFNEIFV